VITDYELYFSDGRDWVDAFKVWQGGLGIWGAIALGALGAWIGCRRRGIPLPAYADAVAPGIAFAQAIGRWGNWFNQELYGRPTDLPWALHITSSTDGRVPGYYHPTFLYESLWCIGVGLLVIWADRRFKLGHGRAFALYVAAYTAGRGWIEYLRDDFAHHILGLRINDWMSVLIFAGAVGYIVVSNRRHPGREAPEDLGGTAPAAEPHEPDARDDAQHGRQQEVEADAEELRRGIDPQPLEELTGAAVVAGSRRGAPLLQQVREPGFGVIGLDVRDGARHALRAEVGAERLGGVAVELARGGRLILGREVPLKAAGEVVVFVLVAW